MAINPLNGSNAIVEAAFVLKFGSPLTVATIESIEGLRELLKPVFPVANRVETLSVQIIEHQDHPTRQIGTTELSGLEFKRFQSNGQLEWGLRAHREFVSANCLAYTRWKDVWPKGREYLLAIAERVVSESTPVAGIGLQYVDRFTQEAVTENCAAGNLFRRDSIFLPTQTYDSGPLWHVHQGWIESGAGWSCLHVLNIGTVISNGQHISTIDHQANLQLDQPFTSAAQLFMSNSEEPKIDKVVNDLHLQNKRVLKNLITSEMAARINLS